MPGYPRAMPSYELDNLARRSSRRPTTRSHLNLMKAKKPPLIPRLRKLAWHAPTSTLNCYHTRHTAHLNRVHTTQFTDHTVHTIHPNYTTHRAHSPPTGFVGNTLLVTLAGSSSEETTLASRSDGGKKDCTLCYLICQGRRNEPAQQFLFLFAICYYYLLFDMSGTP